MGMLSGSLGSYTALLLTAGFVVVMIVKFGWRLTNTLGGVTLGVCMCSSFTGLIPTIMNFLNGLIKITGL